ncbi:MAG: molybdopterin synthase sulfur carrier subunit [Alphaproteobacteria bacterium HGW-Alphaproteobacteria-9]|nr:molybdopterin synthase sulfur carrier subunit [Erythrobacter sp.]PKP63383.1 MAG: molybdopterin synthase sulfur carrier subunit [Alphaproteobacteria bacterium HGW-Alphaproteobacteria-9]
MITVVLLGKLADIGGAPTLTLPAPLDWDGVIAALPAALAAAAGDPRNRVAVNGVLLADKADLQADAGDEIALLPPVSGG